MAFRRSIPQEELRANLTAEQLAEHATTYQPSRGGHFKKPEKPVPGTPQASNKD
ncbi:hypothetical protein ABZZ79_27780 [Streptomyces sp. NPDC006458]|uniref:hypothetical protein n=1 Tax=Streptomyces sp. NPDC006458 TaxID=3154302 RepID=UPI0033A65982